MIAVSSQYYADGVNDRAWLVLLHGWGYHKQSWPLIWLRTLRQHFQLLLVDLPGHGDDICAQKEDTDLQILDEWLQALLLELPARFSLLGWSLGGQIALRLAAQAPVRVQQLLLLASNPSFVLRDRWQQALPAATLEKFQQAFSSQPQKALQRFCALQAQGAPNVITLGKMLNTQVCCRASLFMGLQWLRGLDERGSYHHLTCPLLCLLAEQDALVPQQVGTLMARAGAQIRIAAGSHAILWQNDQAAMEAMGFLVSFAVEKGSVND